MAERATPNGTPTEARDLPTLIDAARLEVERRMNAERDHVDGKIVDSRIWWELRALGQVLTRAAHRAEQIERLAARG